MLNIVGELFRVSNIYVQEIFDKAREGPFHVLT